MDVTDADGVRTITLQRPEERNPLTPDRAASMADHVAAASPDAHDAIVLRGEGPAFCAGGDLEAMAERDERPHEADERLRETVQRLATALLEAPVPVVAAVTGDAVGAGLSLVCGADFAYASPEARFSTGFVRVGLVPDTGGTFLLPRIVGLRTAKRLAMTGEFLDAATAAECDLVSAVHEPEALEDRMADLLATLGDRPTRTVGLTRRAIHENLGTGYERALRTERGYQVQAYGSAAHERGVRSFLDDG